MRTTNLPLLFFVGATTLFASASQAAETLVAEVNGMVCAFCAQGIERKLRKQSQTHDVYVNLGRKVVALELKDGQQLPVATFKSLIQDAGYDVVSTRTETRTVREIKSAITAQ